jgi:hypothetical protein
MDEADPRAKLERFQALIGEWRIEMTHPMVEDTVVRGRATYEWLEGGRFLIQRAVNEHPDFPDSLCVIGVMGSLPSRSRYVPPAVRGVECHPAMNLRTLSDYTSPRTRRSTSPELSSALTTLRPPTRRPSTKTCGTVLRRAV